MPWQANLGEGGEMCTIQVKRNKNIYNDDNDDVSTKYFLVKYKYNYKYFDISIHQVLKYIKY